MSETKEMGRKLHQKNRPGRIKRYILGGFKPSPLFLALAVTLVATILLAACGGGGDESPTAMPTPTPTVASSGGGGETPEPGGDGGGGSQSFTETATLFILSKKDDTIPLTLNAGDVVRVSYTSAGTTTGGPNAAAGSPVDAGIILVVTDPLGDNMLEVPESADNEVEFTADLAGDYSLIFFNNFFLIAQEVEVVYSVNP